MGRRDRVCSANTFALRYLLKHWNGLTVFLHDPKLLCSANTFASPRSGPRTAGPATHTPHHSVQAAVSPASSRSAGVSINLRKDLHGLTRTFSRPVQPAPNLRTHLARDIRDLRRILREAGYDLRRVNAQLQELIRQNKATGGF
jgi:hypothetical protein